MTARHISQLRRLASKMAQRRPVDVEELFQAGAVGFLEAARRFDPAGGAQLGTFCFYAATGRMLDFMRRECRAHGSAALARRLIAGAGPSPEAAYELREALARVSATCRGIDGPIAVGLAGGELQVTIAAQVGMSKAWMSRRVQQLRARLAG